MSTAPISPQGAIARGVVAGAAGTAALTNNVVHWATGSQWGALYGIVRRFRAGRFPR